MVKLVLAFLAGGLVFGLGGVVLGSAVNQGVLETYTLDSLRLLERERDQARELAIRVANGQSLANAFNGEGDVEPFLKSGYHVGDLAAVRIVEGQAVEICFEVPEPPLNVGDCVPVNQRTAGDGA